MREILFRAKKKNWRELLKDEWWVEGFPLKMWGEWHIITVDDENTAYPIDPETLCQYVGQKDQKDNPIWENDRVKTKSGITGKVIWHSDSAAFCLLPDNDGDEFLLLSYWVNEDEIEVIGNVFDNPV